MSADPLTHDAQPVYRMPRRIIPVTESKPASGDTVRRGSKDQEIENLKRLLANVSQRLDALKTR